MTETETPAAQDARHSPTCATGARAEKRGPCDCGADTARPFRFRLLDQVEPKARGIPHRMVELVVDGPLTTSHALELALGLMELTRVEGARAADADAKRRAKVGRISGVKADRVIEDDPIVHVDTDGPPVVQVIGKGEPARVVRMTVTDPEQIAKLELGRAPVSIGYDPGVAESTALMTVDREGKVVDTTEDLDKVPCPGCGHWLADHDGLGVMAHLQLGRPGGIDGGCGFCRHPSKDRARASDWWVCGICGEKTRDDGSMIAASIQVTDAGQCTHRYSGGCRERAAFALFNPDGIRTPVVGLCSDHAELTIANYAEQNGEEWHLVPFVSVS